MRLGALDVLRGLVIVIMALDHVRDYFHESMYALDPLDPRVTTVLLYCTRWITHLCAPTFVFLAGVSILLQAEKRKDTARLSRFLLTRGLWLVVLEVTVISFAWSFSLPLLIFLQVFWAIGCSMMAMAALVWLPRYAVLVIGAGIIALHNLTDGIQGGGVWWTLLHNRGLFPSPTAPTVAAFYPLLPWLGVMAFGYGVGGAFLSPRRDRILVTMGALMLGVFAVLRAMHGYGDALGWSWQGDLTKTAMQFFNVQKYPPSLQYVCVTLGIILVLFPWIARWKGRGAEFCRTLGAVPLASYLAHLIILHALSLGLHWATGRPFGWEFNTIYKLFTEQEAFKGMGFPLWVVYPMWALVIALVYPVARYWSDVKRRRSDWWLSYL